MPLPCSLQLDVYFPPSLDEGAPDESLIAWSVSTDPDHPFPFLIAPRQYASQEIDPITCAATIGTVEVGVIDVPMENDDQDSGWMTNRVHDVLGRRCRLRRYVTDAIGWVVVADGPAGSPKMDSSYSAYRWTIRDTRDTERKTKAFTSGGVTSIVPRGSIYGWGHYDDGGESHVLLPSTLEDPLVGVMQTGSSDMLSVGVVSLSEFFHLDPDDAGIRILEDARLIVDDDGAKAMASSQIGEISFAAQNADVLWRKVGDANWNVARPRGWFAYPASFVNYGYARLNADDREDSRALESVALYMEPSADVPAGFPVNGDHVEFVIRHRGNASASLPYYLEGTLGDVLTKLYNGDYANPVNAGIAGFVYDPAGLDNSASQQQAVIQYDSDAFDLMTDKVLLRQTEVVDDVRDFSESRLYQPSGWMPALDNDGRISPVHRSRPVEIDDALLITDAHVVPSPNWNTGARVISSIEYTYDRYFVPSADSGFEVGPDGVAIRPITIDYDDPDSFRRYGDNPETFDSSAFSAIGTSVGFNLPGQTEQSAFFAQLARFDLLDRFRKGVQVISISARRSRLPNVRAGSWIPWNLSWFPDRATGVRGSEVDAAQIVSIRDDNCTWRTLTLEESGAPGALVDQPGYYTDLTVDLDDFEPGYYNGLIEDSDVAVVPFSIVVTADAPGPWHIGSTHQLTAVVYDEDGNVLDIPVEWASSDDETLSIDSSGLATVHFASGGDPLPFGAHIDDLYGTIDDIVMIP